MFKIYISFWIDIFKIKNTPIRTVRNVFYKVSDWQFTMLIITTFTPFDLQRVFILNTDAASLMFLWSGTSNTFWFPDRLSSKLSLFWKIIMFTFNSCSLFQKKIYMYIDISKLNLLYETKYSHYNINFEINIFFFYFLLDEASKL